jgi:hypothetical protein
MPKALSAIEVTHMGSRSFNKYDELDVSIVIERGIG